MASYYSATTRKNFDNSYSTTISPMSSTSYAGLQAGNRYSNAMSSASSNSDWTSAAGSGMSSGSGGGSSNYKPKKPPKNKNIKWSPEKASAEAYIDSYQRVSAFDPNVEEKRSAQRQDYINRVDAYSQKGSPNKRAKYNKKADRKAAKQKAKARKKKKSSSSSSNSSYVSPFTGRVSPF